MSRQHSPTSALLFMSALALSVSLVVPLNRGQQETSRQTNEKVFPRDMPQLAIPFDPQPISIPIDFELWDVDIPPLSMVAMMNVVATYNRTTHHPYDGLDPPV